MRSWLPIVIAGGLLAACATPQQGPVQYLQYRSWAAFTQSDEDLYRVTCGPPDREACIADYEARGYVRIATPVFRSRPR